MDLKLNLLVVARSTDAIEAVEAAVRATAGIRLQRKLVVNGHVDPLQGVERLPDALILHLGERGQAELESLAARAADRRPPLIVIGTATDPNLLRLAMQAGARDLLPLPLVPEDLLAALARVARDNAADGARPTAHLTVFMNAKGGCGATLLACNVAHLLAAVSQRRVCLLDLDLQFGTSPLYFDLFPKRGLLQALENLDGLDEVAFDGYLAKHPSGLRVLGQAAEDALPMAPPSAQQVKQLLTLAERSHDHVVVDLPRRIDTVATTVIDQAHQIVLVVQQSVTTLRDATRLMNCLRRDLGVSRDRIVTVVNRYEKDSPITLEDIRKTLGCGEPSLVPNDFRVVSACVDTGTPLWEHARGAAITRAVMALETRLGGAAATERPGLFARTLSTFIKQRAT